MTKSTWALGALSLLFPAAAPAADLGTVARDGEKVTLTSVCAYVPRWDTQGWGKPEMTLLLSDQAIDCAAAQGWVNPQSAAFDQVVRRGRGSLLSISTRAGLKLGKVSYFAPGATLGHDDCAGCESTLAEGGAGVAGAIRTTKPLMLASTAITFEVELDIGRPAPPPVGEKLPGDGGEAGTAYLAYLKAHQDGDYAALQKLMPEGEAEDEWGYYEDEQERRQQIQEEDVPKSATVLEGWRFGDSAVLVVEVPHPWQPGQKAKAAIGLGLADGTWRVREERIDFGGSMFGR